MNSPRDLPPADAQARPESRGEPAAALWNSDDLQPGDTYQEGPYLVFTAQYHLRRGYCCNSDCRHCPYK